MASMGAAHVSVVTGWELTKVVGGGSFAVTIIASGSEVGVVITALFTSLLNESLVPKELAHASESMD